MVRRVDLEPQDWFYSPWRNPRIAAAAPALPFNRTASLERLKVLRGHCYEYVNWDDLHIPIEMTSEEAKFWLDVLICVNEIQKVDSQLIQKVKARKTENVLTEERLLSEIEAGSCIPYSTAISCLRALFSINEIYSMLFKESKVHRLGYLRNAFRLYIPHLADSERDAIRKILQPQLRNLKWPAFNEADGDKLHLAAFLGMHKELLPIIERTPNGVKDLDSYKQYGEMQLIVYGLNDPSLVEHHMRRMGLILRTRDHFIGWLAHTEFRALDVVLESILKLERPLDDYARVLARVQAPEAVAPMLELYQKSLFPKIAREWFDSNPMHAISGLTEIISSKKPDHLFPPAFEMLRWLNRTSKKNNAILSARLTAFEPDQAIRIREIINEPPDSEMLSTKTTPIWLAEAVRAVPKPTISLPQWITSKSLPPIRIAAGHLSKDHVYSLLVTVRGYFSKNRNEKGDLPKLLKLLKQHVQPASIEAFFVRLVELWDLEEVPSNRSWVLAGLLGIFAGDVATIKLSKWILRWSSNPPSSGMFGEYDCAARLGFEILTRMHTKAALKQLTILSTISGSAMEMDARYAKRLRKRARICLDAVRKHRVLNSKDLKEL